MVRRTLIGEELMRRIALVTILGILASGPVADLAAGAAPLAGLDGAQRQAAVDKLSAALRERYVYPDTGAKAAEVITANLKSGAYDKLDDPSQFAGRLTHDLADVAHDKHMRVEVLMPPGAAPPPGLTQQLLPPSELGVVRADRLAGGVGYIEVIGFPPLPLFKRTINRAMTSLAGSKALIIDDRRNGGGDPASVAYLVSFLAPQGAHINDIVSRTPQTETFTRTEFHAEPTPVNFAGKPIYVLVSSRTFSGGEEFAYDVQNLKVATVVGESTGGGANPTGGVPLGDGLMASIPFGRAENPVTKTNWEGKGVAPDVAVPAAEAFKVALTRLGQPAVAEIGLASQGQVFAPRSSPLPGSDQVIRRLVEGLASNAPDYSMMGPDFAEVTRKQLPIMHEDVARLGAIQSLKFVEVGVQGGDRYDVTFAGGVRRMAVVLDVDGKIIGANLNMPRTGPPS
jgi:hypothetical protein